MERVAFLVEDTKERLGCLLNPESLEIRRQAGVRQRGGGTPGSVARGDDALVATGGGITELRLDLLFDIGLSGSSTRTEDVRDLTGPIWQLAENRRSGSGRGRIPRVRFIWGKYWNLPGVVAAVAERLDRFSPAGAPQRSWLRMRLLRVDDGDPAGPPLVPPALTEQAALSETFIQRAVRGATALFTAGPQHTVLGGGDGDRRSSERLDAIAGRMYGDPSAWRVLAAANGVADPLHLPVGLALRLPVAGGVTRGQG
jgi:hypothetical protein